MTGTPRNEAPFSKTHPVWPSGTALQGEVSNHRKLLRLRAVVVSVAEKAHGMRQVRAGKANVSEPLLKRRKRSGVIETGGPVVAPG